MFSVPMGLIGVFWALYLTSTHALHDLVHGHHHDSGDRGVERHRHGEPLAIAVIGGLMVSTFFTLILIPTLYVMFEERFPRTIAPIEDDGDPPRCEAPAQ